MRSIKTVEIATLEQRPPPFTAHRHRYTAAQKRGLQYEQKIQQKLLAQYDHCYLPSPWFSYREVGSHKVHYCQPDGLLFTPRNRKLTILEIKLQHTRVAYQQLFNLYSPVVRSVFSSWDIACCEVTRWYDPSERTPAPARLCRDPEDVNLGVFGVHICKP